MFKQGHVIVKHNLLFFHLDFDVTLCLKLTKD